MYEDTLRKHLDEIIDNLDEEDYDLVKKYKNYKLEISDKYLNSRNGCYRPSTMKIQITRHSGAKNANNVKTTLHELAHHLDYCNGGQGGHGKEFYAEYRRLLYSALDLGKISVAEMRDMSHTSQDYNKVMKMLNEYTRKEPLHKKEQRYMYEINVSGLAANDPRLIAHGYKYNQRRKTWFKNIYPSAVDFEKDVLSFNGITEYQLKDANTIQMLDDEQEFLNYSKELEERKETIAEKCEKEYADLQHYIGRLIALGFDFDGLYQQLDGENMNTTDNGRRFSFRYMALGGILNETNGEVSLDDRFTIYEYRINEARKVLEDVDIHQIREKVQNIK